MFVQAAIISRLVESQLSVAKSFDTGDRTVHLRFLLHNSLRFVRGTGVPPLVVSWTHL